MKKRIRFRHFMKRKANDRNTTQTKLCRENGVSSTNQLYNGNLSSRALLSLIIGLGEGEMTVRELYEFMEY